MPATKTAKTSAAQIPTTSADAHRLMIADIDRQRADAVRTARSEATNMIAKLQRLIESIDNGNTPSALMDLPDARKLSESVASAESAARAAEHVRGWIKMIDA